MQPLNSQPPAPGHPDWDGQADARRPRPWLAPGMRHPRIPLSSRMSRAARAASPVRDPPGAALTWVRRCLAVWEGRERAFQGASGRQPALSSGGWTITAERIRGEPSSRTDDILTNCQTQPAEVAWADPTTDLPYALSHTRKCAGIMTTYNQSPPCAL